MKHDRRDHLHDWTCRRRSALRLDARGPLIADRASTANNGPPPNFFSQARAARLSCREPSASCFVVSSSEPTNQHRSRPVAPIHFAAGGLFSPALKRGFTCVSTRRRLSRHVSQHAAGTSSTVPLFVSLELHFGELVMHLRSLLLVSLVLAGVAATSARAEEEKQDVAKICEAQALKAHPKKLPNTEATDKLRPA
jgi:hypothetical protein